ncbi:MAG: hypothetical protein KIS66_01595 [Fimbriimonadaceae bacterium]|nr:hypothetical protein [Fimbriimonadaceae bacterium]
MFRKTLSLLPLALVFAFGCGAGETPVEKMEITKTDAAKPEAGQSPQNVQQAVGDNPNLPPAAKDALLGGNK